MNKNEGSGVMKVKDLIFLKPLGKGAFGDVYLAHREGNPKEVYAVKIVKLSLLTQDKEVERHFQYEMSILKQLDNENVIALYEIKKTKNNYYLLIDYCNGGDLKHVLDKYKKMNNNQPFTQEIVQYILKQLLAGIDYLHNKKNIIHRDIKLDNILINFKTEEDLKNFDILKSEVKICDFGIAKQLTNGSVASTIVGTPFNMAPQLVEKFAEINNGKNSEEFTYDYKADIYSIGTVCYEMIFGVRPFEAKTGEELYKNQVSNNFNFPQNFEKLNVSREIIDFILKMVTFDPKDRLKISELLQHPFITKNAKDFIPYVQTIKSEVPLDARKKNGETVTKVYDYLNFSSSPEIKQLLKNETIYFSISIIKFSSYGMKQARNLVITNENVYHFEGKKLKSSYLITMIIGISLAVQPEYYQFVVHCDKNEHDHYYLLKSNKETYQFFEIMENLYKRKVNQTLKVFILDEKTLKNYVTSEKDREKEEDFSKMPMTNELFSLNEIYDALK